MSKDYSNDPQAREAYLDGLVFIWRRKDENSNLAATLEANAHDVRWDPNNLFRAGVFDGLAQAVAWDIYRDSEVDDINAITAAIYKAYGVAW